MEGLIAIDMMVLALVVAALLVAAAFIAATVVSKQVSIHQGKSRDGHYREENSDSDFHRYVFLRCVYGRPCRPPRSSGGTEQCLYSTRNGFWEYRTYPWNKV